MNTFVIASALSLMMASCAAEPVAQPEAKMQQAQNGAQMAENALRGKLVNAEQENIRKRIELTMDPGRVGFILLLNQAGQPIRYDSVKGKVTSGNKRLTNPQMKVNLNCGQYCSEDLGEAPSDEGTFGSSSPYIFYWNTDGQYVQWSGDYLYSDKPFRTKIEPLVIKSE